MTPPETATFSVYERVAELTRKMLEAARQQHWEHLLELEEACKGAFAELVDTPIAGTMTAETARRKAVLIRQMLADDAAIRELVQPWVAELGQWLGSASRAGRLRDAYAPGHPAA